MIICKTKQEIEKMREAGRVVAQALAAVTALVQPGITTRELDAEGERVIRAARALPTFKGYHGFPAALCISVNEEVVHGIPGSRRLKEGDVVSLDCGATLDGYIGDAAVTVAVGAIAPELEQLMAVTRGALEAAIAKSTVGNRLGDISHAVELHARRFGYGIVQDYCGHGVGRALHEAPQVQNIGSPRTGPRVMPGWTIAIEPMLNLGSGKVRTLADGWTVVTSDGLPSAHFEHTIAVTEDGPVILTLP